MRGFVGSGKTTKALKLALAELEAGRAALICSTDHQFVKDGVYQFDPTYLPMAHKNNQTRVEAAMKAEIDRIYVDNTNLQLWEMSPYVKLAARFDYQVEICEVVDERATAAVLAARNLHGVPEAAIVKMAERWEAHGNYLGEAGDLKQILAAKPPWER